VSFARTCRLVSLAPLRGGAPAKVLDSIQAAIASAETRTSGEIRFMIESALDLSDLWARIAP
jgi:hypothetical protein